MSVAAWQRLNNHKAGPGYPAPNHDSISVRLAHRPRGCRRVLAKQSAVC